MIEGKTKKGVSYKVKKDALNDMRLVLRLSDMQRYMNDGLKSAQAINGLLRFLFVDDEAVDVFMDEVADKHDGICTPDAMIEELTDIFDALKAKK